MKLTIKKRWFSCSRLCRLMGGGGSAHRHSNKTKGLRPRMKGAALRKVHKAFRKVRDLPHIRRQSRVVGRSDNVQFIKLRPTPLDAYAGTQTAQRSCRRLRKRRRRKVTRDRACLDHCGPESI